MILINVVRALYFVFKSLFCDWQKQKEDYGLEYFIKEKDQEDTKNHFNDLRTSTIKRAFTKKTTKEQMIFEVENLWDQVQETLGKYNKIITFLASERQNMYLNMLNATRNGNGQNLDLIEKYCILNDLHSQI